MANWVSSEQYPGMQIGQSENGWMTSDIFFEWFTKFCAEYTQRPLLLIYDGHSTHINLHSSTRQGLKILPCSNSVHTTDRLQPLDELPSLVIMKLVSENIT